MFFKRTIESHGCAFMGDWTFPAATQLQGNGNLIQEPELAANFANIHESEKTIAGFALIRDRSSWYSIPQIPQTAKKNKRSLTPTRALCPFTPKAGVNGNPKTRASLTEFGMTRSRKVLRRCLSSTTKSVRNAQSHCFVWKRIIIILKFF